MNSRFAVGVHILTLLAGSQGVPMTSEYIAASVNTNPSLIRRLLCQLNSAGLTGSQMGTGGGALLAKPADQITLRDVFRAVEAGEMFALHREEPNQRCPVGRHIQSLLVRRFDDATLAMEEALSHTTIADLLHEVDEKELEVPVQA